MLTQLDIRQFAIVESLSLNLNQGMTAITGETGAGKSIALDALGLCLGARAESSMVRTGARKAEVTACFRPSTRVLEWLETQELEQDDDCIIRRTVSSEGRSRAYINGRPVPLSQVRDLGRLLVSLHGQHDHHQLMQTAQQRRLLDQYGGHHSLAKQVRQAYQEWQQLVQEQRQLQEHTATVNARRELLQYQVNELAEVAISPADYAELTQQHQRLANAQSLLADCDTNLTTLYDDENQSAYQLVQQAINRLTGNAELDERFTPLLDMLDQAQVNLEEVALELRRYQDDVAPDPALLSTYEEQLSQLQALSRKHQRAPGELGTLHTELNDELAQMTADNERVAAIQEDIDTAWGQFRQLADKLTTKRQHCAKKLSRAVTQTMAELNMGEGEFAIQVTPNPQEAAGPHGQDDVQFQVTTNAGQPLQPLTKVASGGELSRISLAIQVLTAGQDVLPTLVFDEVDVGISGPTAATVGRLLQQLGQRTQVVCVTHLPQVAARAHQQFRVRKTTRKQQTHTHMELLSEEQRVEELARLLGGDTVSDHAMANARELLAS